MPLHTTRTDAVLSHDDRALNTGADIQTPDARLARRFAAQEERLPLENRSLAAQLALMVFDAGGCVRADNPFARVVMVLLAEGEMRKRAPRRLPVQVPRRPPPGRCQPSLLPRGGARARPAFPLWVHVSSMQQNFASLFAALEKRLPPNKRSCPSTKRRRPRSTSFLCHDIKTDRRQVRERMCSSSAIGSRFARRDTLLVTNC